MFMSYTVLSARSRTAGQRRNASLNSKLQPTLSASPPTRSSPPLTALNPRRERGRRARGTLPHLTNAIRAELRGLRPDVVITFDATGATGNLNHILTGAATLQAVGSMTGVAAPRLYAAVFGRRQLAAGLRIGRLTRRKNLDDVRDALRIAQESQRPTTTVDVRGVLAQRLEAARCYATALKEGAWWMRRWELLSPRLRRRLAPREVYARLIPPVSDSEGMENGLFGEG